ncbi:type I-E CRISPR-associated protein Cse1/CasA [Erwinia sp. OLTSP20]|uniref:type I-E CRISPR-associated protein Cse1/CasA n=1 Tax=unclassified Erwinia TaxID=2622719 RepID=UPI000C19BF45|nr:MULTISPECIES: type I-E CRISPR-associated protein Cse1/CasA [unclassified Erwinia]PIJ49774.1 type I-E CRISPR-associated protein Cse1/CasA [Erwinia sp. OAMSP11]PIJ70873.1 type I-E CRISPR-associated protein Cse1/CasA [Erwinia sp. OLSSP12]PIJ80238.1 type I-E CRISPR-associated protein Cse1/CasA [Erwinia sp. OLCASP19]PIJ82362.1 type I-E CRISPR-associated protein Cse1/CasA [Erwinia sp. OLMTSP26]PIJ85048.1 type I-E CRISPR-associated protein Cse1/CasA [Erwinia sp. OLMDSP33]
MRLLIDPWIPVRPAAGGASEHITLQQLLCDPQQRLLSLPRDDMELAASQLLISIVQILWPPGDLNQLVARLVKPLSPEEFLAGIEDYIADFDLSHPHYPFMQVKGVMAKDVTGMDKLMVGLTGSTCCAFVNQPGQGEALCAGCSAIALFNQASNAPGFGGGFKSGLRGGTPITTLVQQPCLRTTVWANVLTQQNLDKHYPQWQTQDKHDFTWRQPITSNQQIYAHHIGLARGLFWQPAHIELLAPGSGGTCSACGGEVTQRYHGFLKAKFNFTVTDFWLHPHSPSVMQSKKGQTEQRYIGFSTEAPCWTQIGRLLIRHQLEQKQEGRRPALVVEQARELVGDANRLYLSIGGYRNNQAAILERRHEVMVFNQGWERHLNVINEIVQAGDSYRLALRKALYIFAEGMREKGIKGAGVAVHLKAEPRYYRQTNLIITPLLATINYQQPQAALNKLHRQLFELCQRLFDDATLPYSHQPELILTLAFTRRILNKNLFALNAQGEQTDDVIKQTIN